MNAPVCDAASFDRFCHPRLPVCTESGPHFCLPRAARGCGFFDSVLVHTKGKFARKPFILAPWQRNEIVGPLLGNVVWSPEHDRYVRQYRMGWIELARKCGKSELLAGLALYLLAFDGEEGAEIYGAARDRDQARLIWDVASRMVQLSPKLNQREGLRIRSHERRIVDLKTGSFYSILARDALGNLGLNPSGILFDEVIAQPDGQLWEALRTAMGARTEPLMVAATTAGNDPNSFAAAEHAICVKVAEEPQREPHRFVYIRNLPMDADPFDEKLWPFPNPALGDFLSLQALRDEAMEAKNDPSKENSWRQFRCNQWVSQATRWMAMALYRECTGDLWLNADWGPKLLTGREVWCGLDLSAKLDLTSFCVFAPPKGAEPGHALWWHWIPEESLPALDSATSHKASQWVRQGFLRLMPGGVIDYAELCKQIAELLKPYKVREICFDKWSGEFVRQELERLLGKRIDLVPNEPTYVGMTVPMRELMGLSVDHAWNHHGNPVAMFCFDSVEVKRAVDNPDLLKPVKPERSSTATRIDAVVTAALAVGAWRIRGQIPPKSKRAYGFS
jgi:phage terminase large subunit-like protein